MFTFSFSTAFAAQTTAEKDAAVAADLQLATEVLNSHAASFQAAQKYAGTYADAAIEYAVGAAKSIGLTFINNLSAQLAAVSGDYTGSPVTTELNAWLGIAGSTTYANTGAYAFTGASFTAKYNEFVSAQDLEARRTEVLALIGAVNPSDYYVSEDGVTDDAAKAQTLKDKATAAVKAVTATGNNLKLIYTDNTVYANDKTYVDAFNFYLYGADSTLIHTKDTAKATVNAAQYKGLFAELNALTTIEEKKAQDAQNEENKTFGMAELTTFGKVTFYKANRVAADANVTSAYGYTASTKELNGVAIADPAKVTSAEASAANAALMARIEKTLAVLDVYFTENPTQIAVKIGTGSEQLMYDTLKDGQFATAIANAEAAMEKYDTVVAAGEALKLQLDPVTGVKKYDDAQIDELVAKAETHIYANYANNTAWKAATTAAGGYFEKLTDISSAVEKAISEAKAKFTSGKKADEKYTAAYYDTDAEVQAEVAQLLTVAQDDLTAAKSVEEVEQIMADLDAALAKIRTKAEETAVEKAIADGNYVTYLAQYAEAQKTLMGADYRADSFKEAVDDPAVTSAYEAGVELLYSAKTADEVPALFAQAKALFDKIVSDKEIKEAGKAIADKIAALPAAATLSERAALLEANAAYEEFKEIYGAKDSDIYNLALLTAKLGRLKDAEIKSIKDAVAALPAVSKLTLADKEKVEAIRAELEDYLAEHDVNSYGYNGTDAGFNITSATYNALTAAETKLDTLAKEAVAKEIYALPENVTLADKAAVEAARASYDALSKTAQAQLIASGYYAKLVKAENALKALQVGSVESLKLKASTKAYKGYIKLSWTVTGDAEAADGFQIYRSTKSSSAGKKIYTTKKATTRAFKNTSVKKGTKYYYKVRAFKVVDGVTYYSDWSSRGIRTAK